MCDPFHFRSSRAVTSAKKSPPTSALPRGPRLARPWRVCIGVDDERAHTARGENRSAARWSTPRDWWPESPTRARTIAAAAFRARRCAMPRARDRRRFARPGTAGSTRYARYGACAANSAEHDCSSLERRQKPEIRRPGEDVELTTKPGASAGGQRRAGVCLRRARSGVPTARPPESASVTVSGTSGKITPEPASRSTLVSPVEHRVGQLPSRLAHHVSIGRGADRG